MVRNLDSSGRFHTDWLNMLYPRLRIARDLLSDDGLLFISIDDNEQDSLKKICDEIFGSPNRIGVLKVFYVIEWLVFFIPMWMVAYAKLYYCEFCEDYMESKEHFITDVERVGQHLEEIKAGDLSCLNSPGSMSEKLDTEVDQQYKLDLHRCKSCGDRIFNLYHLTMKYKKGKSGAREVDKTVTLIEDTYALRPEGE